MGRHLLAATVVLVDTLLFAGRAPLWLVSAYAVAAVLVVLWKRPAVAFVGALVLGALTGGSHVLLLWAAYRAGRAVVRRTEVAVVAGAAVGWCLIAVATGPRVPQTLAIAAVFVALPLLAGRYVAQQERQRELAARQERLDERLRIARDMHDSLGRRLSLVSVQAAALEVGALPSPQREAVAQLAEAARSAVDELYDVIGALRGCGTLDALVEEFRAAGVPVRLETSGEAGPVPEAGYRVVEEGLTNAAKHAPNQPVTVRVAWEADSVLVSVGNPVGSGGGSGGGRGLTGLAERVGLAGGFVDHGIHNGQFRLVAMLPYPAEAVPSRRPAVGLGVAVALLMFLVLPAAMLVGIG